MSTGRLLSHALLGCACIAGCISCAAQVETSGTALPRSTSVVQGQSGLEVIRIALPASPQAMASIVEALRPPEGLDPQARRRLGRSGISVSALTQEELVSVLTAAGGALSESRAWIGQTSQWQPALRATTSGHERIFVDGRLLGSAPGHIDLMVRGWGVPGPGAPEMDVQCQVEALPRGSASVPLALEPKLAPRAGGHPLPGTGAYFTLRAGEVALLTVSGGTASFGRGPEGAGPPAPRVGDVLMQASVAGRPIVTAVILVPCGLEPLDGDAGEQRP